MTEKSKPIFNSLLRLGKSSTMSDRYRDYKGSSRSARDDSRTYRERRMRSRSPIRSDKSRRSSEKSRSRDKDIKHHEEQRNKSPDNWEESDEEVPAPPPPPRITKISIGFQKPKAPIKMSLGSSTSKAPPPVATVASVFSADDDDDDEPEEMPAEARMRMRNIGRETPTSAGPNSFGKTKQGFCDAKKVFEKNLKQALDTVDRPTMANLPQTIYRIKGP